MKNNEVPLPTAAAIERLLAEKRRQKFYCLYPDDGPYRRELYPKHIEFMALGAVHRARMVMAGNQVGKTEMGAYEMTAHLTGRYPKWWTGRRFENPIRAWAVGETAKTVRGIIQVRLLGPEDAIGTGMLPSETIAHVSRSSVPGALDSIQIHYVSGGVSNLEFKSYEQGRKSFQGTTMDVIWLDEEPPYDVYTECLVRTITTNGIVYTTFTPLQGMTPLILSFMDTPALTPP